MDRSVEAWFDGRNAWHGRLALAAAIVVVGLTVGVAFVRRFLEPSRTPEQLWKLKKDATLLLSDHLQGLSCAAAAEKLSVAPDHLQPVLEELIQERFLVAEDEGGVTVYKLKRFAGGPS